MHFVTSSRTFFQCFRVNVVGRHFRQLTVDKSQRAARKMIRSRADRTHTTADREIARHADRRA